MWPGIPLRSKRLPLPSAPPQGPSPSSGSHSRPHAPSATARLPPTRFSREKSLPSPPHLPSRPWPRSWLPPAPGSARGSRAERSFPETPDHHHLDERRDTGPILPERWPLGHAASPAGAARGAQVEAPDPSPAKRGQEPDRPASDDGQERDVQ